MSRANAPLVALLVARCLVEAVAFAGIGAAVHVFALGRDPFPFGQAAALLFGVGLVLAAVLREARATKQSLLLAVLVIGAFASVGFLLPTRGSSMFDVLTRVIGFGILGEIFLWRSLSIARGATRWLDARSSALWAAVALGFASLLPGIETGALVPLALLGVAAAGLSLSLARSAEELEFAREEGQGGVSTSSATGAAFLIGALAVLVSVFAPAVQSMIVSLGDVVGPILAQVFYFVALPFGYLAAFLLPFLRGLAGEMPERPDDESGPPGEEPALEMVEATRPLVIGAVEVIVVIAAILAGILLIDRLTRDRRVALAGGTTLAREALEGYGIRQMLAGLLPSRPRKRVAPVEDGSPAGIVRALYWRLLGIAEARGTGWRAPEETPAEHEARLRLEDAAPVVSAFERVRYGEVIPDEETVRRASEALARLETPR